ncbi:hypothetical protein PUN28_019793 [Cardiocondyla obscurior]|uniref:Uncharacterized protein n=1 Tax=Cardiocondyla obscurior TaxID=286306 RepID=A0AAW2EBD9_9HYME
MDHGRSREIRKLTAGVYRADSSIAKPHELPAFRPNNHSPTRHPNCENFLPFPQNSSRSLALLSPTTAPCRLRFAVWLQVASAVFAGATHL